MSAFEEPTLALTEHEEEGGETLRFKVDPHSSLLVCDDHKIFTFETQDAIALRDFLIAHFGPPPRKRSGR